MLTAIGNDYGYERLFARQVEAVGAAGDVFIGISTSGRSPNIVGALQVARAKGLVTVGLTGRGGGLMPELCDHCLRTPSDETPRIQEGHIAMGHTLCSVSYTHLDVYKRQPRGSWAVCCATVTRAGWSPAFVSACRSCGHGCAAPAGSTSCWWPRGWRRWAA